jgi:DNA-binding CsgD family transcriptional regulator
VNLSLEAVTQKDSADILEYLCLGLQQSNSALFLLADDLSLLFANSAGHRLLRGKLLRLKERRLLTGRRSENTALQAALRAASETSSLTRLCDREGCGILILTMQRLLPGAAPPVIIVRAIDLRASPVLPTAEISKLFGLSPAEARVAGSLLSGNDPAAIAVALGVSAETVRTHLKQAMVKTATHSQAQLMGVLLRGTQAMLPS